MFLTFNIGFRGRTSDGIAGNGGTEGVFQKWDQTPDFGLKSLILVPFCF